jgi:xanthine phosphoribosyltransferase
MPVDLPLSWQEIHVAAKGLSEKLKASNLAWDKVIAVTRGGLVPACLVARDLDIRVIDTISVASYDHQHQSEIKLLKAATETHTGKGCLVVDDLSDTGSTFRALREVLPDATFVCLYVKPNGKPSADYYVHEVSQDTWIYLPWEDQDFPPHIMAKIGGHL